MASERLAKVICPACKRPVRRSMWIAPCRCAQTWEPGNLTLAVIEQIHRRLHG